MAKIRSGGSSKAEPEKIWGTDVDFGRSVTQSGMSLTLQTLDSLVLPLEVGEYVVQRLIGAGGMGRVYYAEHRRMARPVALKVLPLESSGNAEALKQFHQEIRVAARLLHPNIVTAFDAGEIGDLQYLVMEYVDGSTLDRLLLQFGALTSAKAVALIKQAATGLQYAHRSGVIHRDIKPSNMILAKDGTLKLLDLGLATLHTASDGEEGSAKICGTPEFMSPEQFLDPMHVDHRADIYSLGCTLYYLMTTRCPYSGTFTEIFNCHRYSDFPQISGNGDERLTRLLAKMVAKSPAQRFSNAGELIDALEVFAEEQPQPVSTIFLAGNLTPPDELMPQPPTIGSKKAICSVVAMDFDGQQLAFATSNSLEQASFQPYSKNGEPLFAFAVAERRNGELVFGQEALTRLRSRPNAVKHDLFTERNLQLKHAFLGTHCPNEAIIGLILRHVVNSAPQSVDSLQQYGITVPSCFGQRERRNLLNAAFISGLPSLRLLNRSLAAIISQKQTPRGSSRWNSQVESENWIVVDISDISTEIAVVRLSGNHIQCTSVVGSRDFTLRSWKTRLAQYFIAKLKKQVKLSPSDTRLLASIQTKASMAFNQLVTAGVSSVKLNVDNQSRMLSVNQRNFESFAIKEQHHFSEMLEVALVDAGLDASDVNRCLLVGHFASSSTIRRLIEGIGIQAEFVNVDQISLACGAAKLLANSTLNHQTDARALDVIGCIEQAVGVARRVNASTLREPSIVIPRLTSLPTRIRRKLASHATPDEPLEIVESSGYQIHPWITLKPIHISPGVHESSIDVELDLTEECVLSIAANHSSRSPEHTNVFEIACDSKALKEPQLVRWKEWCEQLVPRIR